MKPRLIALLKVLTFGELDCHLMTSKSRERGWRAHYLFTVTMMVRSVSVIALRLAAFVFFTVP